MISFASQADKVITRLNISLRICWENWCFKRKIIVTLGSVTIDGVWVGNWIY
jgi:hypothetical protein